MLDRETADACLPLLSEEQFFQEQHRLIWRSLLALAEAGKPIDAVTVAGWLRERGYLARVDVVYLGKLLDACPAFRNCVDHCATVIDKWRLREAIRVCYAYAGEGYVAAEVQDYLDKLEHAVFAVTHSLDGTSGPERIQVAISEEFKKLAAGEQRMGVSTGIKELDQMLCGMHPGNLYILAARPGMGKSAFAAMSSERAAAAGGAALFFSLEMPKEQLAARMLCCGSSVDVSKYRQGLLSDGDWNGVTAAGQRLSALPLWIDDRPGLGLLEMRAAARRVSAEHGSLGLVVVDYLQLMSSDSRDGSREAEVSSVSRGLKRMAKELHVPVLALSQLNRGVESRSDKRPLLSDLRESGSIEQDADAVVFIYRDGYYSGITGDGETELIVAKQRSGPTGTALCRFVDRFTRFEDSDASF
jgi:replicative DNA helicase